MTSFESSLLYNNDNLNNLFLKISNHRNELQ